MTEAIKPSNVQEEKNKTFPSVIIEVFNDLIVKGWNGTSSTVHQDTAARMIASELGITTEEAYKRKYLDIEDIFEKAGWLVVYDKPGYCEAYAATFKFTKKKKGD